MKSCEIMRRAFGDPSPEPNLFKSFEEIFMTEGYQDLFKK